MASINKIARPHSFGLKLVLFLLPISGWSAEMNELNYPAPRVKKSSWKANVFAGSALLAVVTGIAIICWDGGTSTEATERLNKKHHH